MTKPEAYDYADEANHPIIERPYQYQVVGLVYHVDLDDHLESYIDLTLVKDATIRRLRFWGPQDLEIEKSFPTSTSGMKILDVSKRQLQDLGVAVLDFEASHGSITFWAKNVMDLDAI